MIGNNHSSCFFVIFLSLVLTSFFAKSMTFRHIFAAHEGSHTTIGNGFGDASENERSSNIPGRMRCKKLALHRCGETMLRTAKERNSQKLDEKSDIEWCGRSIYSDV